MSGHDAYREHLHAWARHQLEQHSSHTGPFDNVSVSIEHIHGYSVESDYLSATIEFRHNDCELTSWDGGPCRDTGWSLRETTDVVTMLNEMLALADEPEAEQ
jgi:hypothetical protein